jgi:hypothetical protein
VLLREIPDAVEADLKRFYSVDLGDLWRGGLSLRRLSVYLHNLPPESAVHQWRSGLPRGWDLHSLLLADLFHAFTGQPHPNRPKPKDPAKKSAHADLLRRLKEQRERLGKPEPVQPN